MENGAAGAVRNEKKLDLALVGSLPMAGGLVPRTLEEALQLVKLLSESNLIPAHLRGKPADVYVIIAKGMELGLKPMHALSELFVVEGKPGCSAALKRALCLSSPVCEYFQLIESTAEKCTYEAKRKGAKDPSRITMTWKDAERAGLATKDTYKKYPHAMLRAWTSRALADADFPDVTQGLRNDDDREVEVHGEVMEVRPNRAPLSAAAPPAPPLTVVPVEHEEGELVPPEEAPASSEGPPAMTPEEQLGIQIKEAASRQQLNVLVDTVNAVKNLDLRGQLKKEWTARYNDLDPKKAAPK